MKTIVLFMSVLATIASAGSVVSYAGETEDDFVARGKYLIAIGGCNDCHTAGFAATGGAVDESEWLLGDSLGYRGPWGTTYPANLREYFGKLTEEEWVEKGKKLTSRPPMPYWAITAMTEEDLVAVYRYITSLELKEQAVPVYLPPDKEPKAPYIQWPGVPE